MHFICIIYFSTLKTIVNNMHKLFYNPDEIIDNCVEKNTFI